MDVANGEYKLQHAILEQKRENKKLAKDLQNAKEELAQQKEKAGNLEIKLRSIARDGCNLLGDSGEDLMVVSTRKNQAHIEELKELQRLWSFNQRELMDAKEFIQEQEKSTSKLKRNIEDKNGEIAIARKNLEASQGKEKHLKSLFEEGKENHLQTNIALSGIAAKNEEIIRSTETKIELLTKEHEQKIQEITMESASRFSEVNSRCDEFAEKLLRSEEKTLDMEMQCREKESLICRKEKENMDLRNSCKILENNLAVASKGMEEKVKTIETCRLKYDEFLETHDSVVSGHDRVCQDFQQQIEVRDEEIKMLKEKMDLMTIKMRRHEGKPKWKN